MAVGVFLAFAAPNAQAGPLKNVVPTVTTETEYLWGGAYLSMNVGGIWTNYDLGDYTSRVDLTRQFNELIGAVPQTGTSPPQATEFNQIFFSESGHESTSAAVIGGADVGYNFQFGHFVIGPLFGFQGTRTTNGSLERDFQSNAVTITSPGTAAAAFADTTFTGNRHAEQNWLGRAGVQAGFAWRRLFFYVTGGAAFSQIDLRTFDVATTDFFDAAGGMIGRQRDRAPGRSFEDAVNNVLTGWYVGAGTQFALTDVVRMGVEYRHDDYGDRLYHLTESVPFRAVHPGATRVDVNDNQVVFKVSLMLGRLTKAAK
jgi:opacity protein-like surface antigen